MIVSDEKKFVMFCPPKTGSSTLTTRLLDYDSRDNFYYQPRWNEEKFKIEELKHLTYEEFLEYEDINLVKDYFKFCFVRNPYDRIYSGFLMRCHHIKNVKHPRLAENKEYLSKLNTYLENRGYSFNRSFIALAELGDIGFIPLNAYTHYKDQGVLEFIGFVERFEDDFKRVCDMLQITPASTTSRVIRLRPKAPCDPHNMRRADYKYLDRYDRSSIKYVNEVYAKDFKLYGYQKLDPNGFPEKVEKDISLGQLNVIA